MKQKLFAEFFGTTTLAFAILASLSSSNPLIITPVVAALVLGLFVYTVGPISGSHLNPAVTVGVWAIKKIPTKDALLYILVQSLGGAFAVLIASALFAVSTYGFVAESTSDVYAEFVGMTIFTFGIASVIYGKTADYAAGLVIGGSLLLGIMLAVASGSAGILNPAVGIALGMVSLSNIAGAVSGSVFGMYLYRFMVR